VDTLFHLKFLDAVKEEDEEDMDQLECTIYDE
jgi:hypothetical protein